MLFSTKMEERLSRFRLNSLLRFRIDSKFPPLPFITPRRRGRGCELIRSGCEGCDGAIARGCARGRTRRKVATGKLDVDFVREELEMIDSRILSAISERLGYQGSCIEPILNARFLHCTFCEPPNSSCSSTEWE